MQQEQTTSKATIVMVSPELPAEHAGESVTSSAWIEILSDGSIVIVCLVFTILILRHISRKRRFNRHTHNQMKSKKILNKIRSFPYAGQRIRYLRTIDPFVFEELLLDAFKAKGYKVERNKRYTGDQGIDGVVWKKERKYLVQAKRYRGHINLKHVKDFITLVDEHECHGFFCHTGRTGKRPKRVISEHNNITFISGESLIQLIAETKSNA